MQKPWGSTRDLVTVRNGKSGISARSSIHGRLRKDAPSHVRGTSRARLLQFAAFAGFRTRIVKREVERLF